MKRAYTLLTVTLLTTLSIATVGVADDKKPAPAPATTTERGKEVTLTGNMVCAKCGLHGTKSCQNVLKVGEAGKETKYYLVKNDVAQSNHGKVCGGETKATVKGAVKEEGGKKNLTASSIEYPKP